MRWEDFNDVVQLISPEEKRLFKKLSGMFDQDRPFIDDLTPEKAMITAKGLICEWVALDSLRIDNDGNVYLLESIYNKHINKTGKDRGWSRMRQAEEKRNKSRPVQANETLPLFTKNRPSPEPEIIEPEPPVLDSDEPPPLPDCKPWEAEGEDLQKVQAHNSWLREHGRSNEQVIPF